MVSKGIRRGPLSDEDRFILQVIMDTPTGKQHQVREVAKEAARYLLEQNKRQGAPSPRWLYRHAELEPPQSELQGHRFSRSSLQERIAMGLADPISDREREQLAEMKRKLDEKEHTRSLLQRLRDKIAETRQKRSS